MDPRRYRSVREQRRFVLQYVAAFTFSIALCMLLLYIQGRVLNAPPGSFPVGREVVIEEGMSQLEVTQQLDDAGVVRSSLLLHLILTHFFEDSFTLAGTYSFTEPLSSYEVAYALTHGLYQAPTLKLLLPEGFSVHDFYDLLPEGYVPASRVSLSSYEGYLFPDTYFITEEMSVEEIITLLTDTMAEKLAPYREAIEESPFTTDEVLILASIIEREANDEESMRLVSGVLQNRLEAGMPLQADATLNYILGKTSAELTLDDLAIDSPFNTYRNAGLPPGPIANPGIAAIEAVLYPTKSDYFYYLTGEDGDFYFAVTFDEHVRNKELYLE